MNENFQTFSKSPLSQIKCDWKVEFQREETISIAKYNVEEREILFGPWNNQYMISIDKRKINK